MLNPLKLIKKFIKSSNQRELDRISKIVTKINLLEESAKNFGYDAKEGKYVDMLKEGIIDPTKVTRIALENAASVAGMILTTECALVDIKEESPAPAGGMPPMGGGMPGMM